MVRLKVSSATPRTPAPCDAPEMEEREQAVTTASSRLLHTQHLVWKRELHLHASGKVSCPGHTPSYASPCSGHCQVAPRDLLWHRSNWTA